MEHMLEVDAIEVFVGGSNQIRRCVLEGCRRINEEIWQSGAIIVDSGLRREIRVWLRIQAR
jgi:hypothetical protein